MSSSDDASDTLGGCIYALASKLDVGGIEVWFRYQPVDGEPVAQRTVSNDDGTFSFDLPSEPLADAKVGLQVEGAPVVDLEPDGKPLEPGDVTIVVDDTLPLHLRYAG